MSLPCSARSLSGRLALDPNDNQGARFCLVDVRAGLSWEDTRDREDRHQSAGVG